MDFLKFTCNCFLCLFVFAKLPNDWQILLFFINANYQKQSVLAVYAEFLMKFNTCRQLKHLFYFCKKIIFKKITDS